MNTNVLSLLVQLDKGIEPKVGRLRRTVKRWKTTSKAGCAETFLKGCSKQKYSRLAFLWHIIKLLLTNTENYRTRMSSKVNRIKSNVKSSLYSLDTVSGVTSERCPSPLHGFAPRPTHQRGNPHNHRRRSCHGAPVALTV